MNGLFSRLAQQHINQRSSSITPAPSPVFPVQLNEHDAAVTDVNQEQLLPHRHFEPGTQIKNTETVMNDYSDTPVSNSPAGDEPDVATQKTNTPVTSSLTPVLESVIKESTAFEAATPLTPEAGSSIQPQLPGGSDSQQIPLVSDDDKENSSSKTEDTYLSPANNSISNQALNNHQVHPLSTRNRNAQSTQKFGRHVHDENQTTINVSIGQIDIRATHEEKIEKKSPSRSRRARSNALEEYYQKRVRGER